MSPAAHGGRSRAGSIYRVESSKGTPKSVQPISRGHLQIIEPDHRVDLIELATHDRPQFARDTPSCLTVDAVPDVARPWLSFTRGQKFSTQQVHCFAASPRLSAAASSHVARTSDGYAASLTGQLTAMTFHDHN